MPAAVVVTPASVNVGDLLSFAATGFALTHAISLVVTGPDGDFYLHDAATTDGAGAATWSGEIAFDKPGILSYSVNDGTTTVAGTVQASTRA